MNTKLINLKLILDSAAGSPDEVIAPPSVDNSTNGEIPTAAYTCRIKAAEDQSPAGKDRRLELKCEIISPDVVQSQTTGAMCQVAGRTFSLYACLNPGAKWFTGSYKLLGKLGLLREDGAVLPKQIVEQANAGGIFFVAILSSEESIARHPARAGQKIGDPILVNGKPHSKGFQVKLPSEGEIVGRTAAPEGFIAAPY